MNKTYESKVTISLSYVPQTDENRMITTRHVNDTDSFELFADTNKIVFLNENSPVGEIEPIDVSINKTGGVLAYVDRSNEENIVTYIKADGIILFPEDSSAFFENFTNLSEIEGLENINTYYVTDMNAMFFNCSSLANLDLSTFDTSNLERMSSMFSGMNQLENINLTNFDTSRVIEMTDVFAECSSLTSLDLSHFDTSKVTNMSIMFEGCSRLTSLNLSNFNTSQVTTMERMYNNCSNLTDLNISSFDTAKVTNVALMFENTPLLTNVTYSDRFIYHDGMIYTDTMFDNSAANKPQHQSLANVFNEDTSA